MSCSREYKKCEDYKKFLCVAFGGDWNISAHSLLTFSKLLNPLRFYAHVYIHIIVA